MVKCEGTELHEHFSRDTNTYVRHRHEHNPITEYHNDITHHSWEEHHLFSSEELMTDFEDTGRKVGMVAVTIMNYDNHDPCKRDHCKPCKTGIWSPNAE
jgi:hypothetical protein